MDKQEINFDSFYNRLKNTEKKKELTIDNLLHHKKTITLILNHESFAQVTTAPIIAFNHNSGNYMKFTYQNELEHEKIFANKDVFLILQESLYK